MLLLLKWGRVVVVADGPGGLSAANRAFMLLADVVLTLVQPVEDYLRSAVKVLRLVD